MGLVFLAVSAAALLVFWMDNTQPFPQDENGSSVVSRNSQGQGEREEKLKVQIGDTEEMMTVTVGEQANNWKSLCSEKMKAWMKYGAASIWSVPSRIRESACPGRWMSMKR